MKLDPNKPIQAFTVFDAENDREGVTVYTQDVNPEHLALVAAMAYKKWRGPDDGDPVEFVANALVTEVGCVRFTTDPIGGFDLVSEKYVPPQRGDE